MVLDHIVVYFLEDIVTHAFVGNLLNLTISYSLGILTLVGSCVEQVEHSEQTGGGIHRSLGMRRIDGTLLLADGFGEDDADTLAEHIGGETILQRVGRIIYIEDVIHRSLGLLHRQVETILTTACYGQNSSRTILTTGIGRKVGEVLLRHLTKTINVNVADKIEGEVGGIGEALLA